MRKTSFGSTATKLVLLFFVLGLLALFYLYEPYIEKYYIRFYDSDMVRYIAIPPFSTRITPASDELFGKCSLKIATSYEIALNVLHSTCEKNGFFLSNEDGALIIHMTSSYKVNLFFDSQEQIFTFEWQPILPERLRLKAEAIQKP